MLFVLCIFMVISVASYYFIRETTEDIKKQEEQFLGEIANQNATIVKRTLELNLDNLETIADIVDNHDEFDIAHTMRLLNKEMEESSLKRMGYADLNGDAITTDSSMVVNIAERSYFKEALKGNPNVSESFEDKISGGGAINVYAVPLYYKGELKGVIFATRETDIFSDILETSLFTGESFSYIITKEGTPVIYSKSKNVSSDFDNFFEEIELSEGGKTQSEHMKNDIAQEKSGMIEYGRGKVKMVCAYSHVGINDWYVVSVVPKAVISQNANNIILRNTLTVALTAFLFTGLLILFFIQNRKNRLKLERIAYFDELLGMPNFNAFKENAQKILDHNPKKQFSFVKLDVDNFKMINDRFGFDEGNPVLRNIAKALSEVVTDEGELFSRVAVDEFILMLNENSKEEIDVLRQKFINKFYEQENSGIKHYIKFPAGYYRTNLGEKSIEKIFEKVNYAHRMAKAIPEKNGVTEFYYDDFQKNKALREKELEDKMTEALKNKDFKVYLQAKYELKNETMVGAEALVRWAEDGGELISPILFIPLFERNGFVIKLDMYMFEEVCCLIRSWIDEGKEVVTVSVNFSRHHLLDDEFINKLEEIAKRYDVPRHYIEIELTETAVFENIELLENVLVNIHKAGFTMSMDDFGTGYSSLGLLKTLSVDAIKMDRSFFDSDNNKKRTKAVVECIISMAQKLDIHTVAEGVEDLEHIELLREVGCEVVQGYYYAKPMPAEDFAKKLNQNKNSKTK